MKLYLASKFEFLYTQVKDVPVEGRENLKHNIRVFTNLFNTLVDCRIYDEEF